MSEIDVRIRAEVKKILGVDKTFFDANLDQLGSCIKLINNAIRDNGMICTPLMSHWLVDIAYLVQTPAGRGRWEKEANANVGAMVRESASTLGKLGGKVKSPAKSVAATARNAKRKAEGKPEGGRPRKTPAQKPE